MNTISISKEQTDDLKQSGLRNSLLELYRFLFAMWVVWYHGYFLFSNQFFDDGYMAVEFFFILSGFYLLKNVNKYADQPFFVGLFKMIWGKVKPLGIPFIIGIVFIIWQRVLAGVPILMGYLWYIPIMLLAFCMIYSLKRLIKKDLPFVLVLLAIMAINYVILYVPIIEKFGVSRGLGAVSIGVLISLIPKKVFKIKNFNLNAVITLVIFLTVFLLAYIPEEHMISEYLSVLLFLPALIYFTSTLKVNYKFFNFLGSCSFLLYVYQCVLKIIKAYFSIEQFWLFIILICLVAVNKLICYCIEHKKHKTALIPA